MKFWYSAKLLYRAVVPSEIGQPALCEESIRVLRAGGPEEAAIRAAAIGRLGEHSYGNEAGQTVCWSFIAVLEVQELGEEALADGTEVFSSIFRANDRTVPLN